MDEADKYKQRLEAIAEKRRLQDVQEKARREMEDEKLRLQQLKRKSLRDQWLMEGAPLSPTSPDSQSPRSPLWGSQAQELEKRIDSLQSESQRLAEEEEKLKEKMEDGQTETVRVGEADAETTEDEVKTNQSPPKNETTVVLTNGRGHFETDTSPRASEQSNQSPTNGPVVASGGVISMILEPGSSVSVSDPSQVTNVYINEEEEGAIVVMRAERVIVADEEDEVPEDFIPREDQGKTMSEELYLPKPEAGRQVGDTAEEEPKAEAAPETFRQPEESAAAEPTKEARPATSDGSSQGGMETNENGAEEIETEGNVTQSEDSTFAQVQPLSDSLLGTSVCAVPVYSQAALSPELKAEGSPEGAEAALKPKEPATMPGQFQEVPLAAPQVNRRIEVELGEHEPLLVQASGPDARAEQAAANSSVSTEKQSPTRASQGGETESPKRKTCQCCSVM